MMLGGDARRRSSGQSSRMTREGGARGDALEDGAVWGRSSGPTRRGRVQGNTI
jgi:hypothetical protein